MTPACVPLKKNMLIQLARSAKHALYVGKKRTNRLLNALGTEVTSRAWFRHNERVPYTYRPGMYRRSFLNWDVESLAVSSAVPRRIFCLWTGENEVSSKRRQNLERMRSTQRDLPIILVTPENLHEWIVPWHPLHRAYENLSLIHRSDYLRAYLMHYHGGGYADIKNPLHSWVGAFDSFEAEDLWFIGYPERSTQWVAHLSRDLGSDLRRYYRIVPGGCSYIARPGTRLTGEWLAEVERRLDYFSSLLEQNPGGVRNEVDSYPIGWNDLLAKVLHPLALKHHAHIRVTDRLVPDLEDYQ